MNINIAPYQYNRNIKSFNKKADVDTNNIRTVNFQQNPYSSKYFAKEKSGIHFKGLFGSNTTPPSGDSGVVLPKGTTQKDIDKLINHYAEKDAIKYAKLIKNIFEDYNTKHVQDYRDFVCWLYKNHEPLVDKEPALSDSYSFSKICTTRAENSNPVNRKVATEYANYLDVIGKNEKLSDIATKWGYNTITGKRISVLEYSLTVDSVEEIQKKRIKLEKLVKRPDLLNDEKNEVKIADLFLKHDEFDKQSYQEFIDKQGTSPAGTLIEGSTEEDNCIEETEKTKQQKPKENKTQSGLKGFARVGGQDKAIKELNKKLIRPFKCPELYAPVPTEKGIILYGPPGTGKTLLATALSEEIDGNFKSINATEMEHPYVGQTEMNWRKLFTELEKNQPAVLFVDEADALCKKRGGRDVHGDKELNQFLDLVSKENAKDADVYIILATNNIESFDPAVTRSGRFGTKIEMLPPQTKEDISSIFDIHTKDLKMTDDVKENSDKLFERLLKSKSTGADIAQLAILAHGNAIERLGLGEKIDNDTITKEDIKSFAVSYEDFDKGIDELEKSKINKSKERQHVGYNR